MLQTPLPVGAEAKAERLSPLRPIGAVAALLERRIGAAGGALLVYVAQSGRRRRDIAELLRLLAGPERVAEFAALDGLPGDGLPPSAEAMGGRMATLRWLRDAAKRPAIVLTTPAALIRRVPPPDVLDSVHLEFSIGDSMDLDAVGARLARIGYVQDERVDEPGEFALRGRVLEIFPAAAPRPCRIEHRDGRVAAIRSYDPATQRSVADSVHLIVDPASEFLPRSVADTEPPPPADAATLSGHYGRLASFFDFAPDAACILEEGAGMQADAFFQALDEAMAEAGHAGAQDDYLARPDYAATLDRHLAAVVAEAETPASVPVFARQHEPFAAFAAFAGPLLEDDYRVVIAGPAGGELRRLARQAGRALGQTPKSADSWTAVRAAKGGGVFSLAAPLGEGFLAAEDRIAVVALRDLAGQRADVLALDAPTAFGRQDEVFAIGDAVVHLDHGVAILDGVETVASEGLETEALRLRYAEDATLLVPMTEIGSLWRYGGAASDVKLDRLKGESWAKRRNATIESIARTAERMLALQTAKAESQAPVLTPDRVAFERFCARFPYELTRDQAAATAAVLADLESGRPMDRLICGDVGFGKTEVALRAAAAAVFAGRQVAVVAPTTILAQQHFLAFRKRFARQGITVVRLSRLAEASEAEAAKAALADGSALIVVGSHALLGKDVHFADLALVVIDEEQRFGAAQKQALRDLSADIHVLTMTATPIPRTLQAGFVGLHKVSVIATPPSRRRPIRTLFQPFDDDAVRDALITEKARGGQSFVVCPRIEDLEPMAERLKRRVPDLAVTVLHGQMSSEEMDDAMLAFASGRGDVLLATSIVESGLDLPNANTMIVWRADLYGLAQLHQLRGRVGRGTRRGLVMLTTDPEAVPTPGAVTRLETLCAHSDLGAGFTIAARDLDLRGTGELLGEEQAGHLQLIGLALYRRMLERALIVARGETPPEDWRPELSIGPNGFIPADYVPEPDLRIELAVLLERTDDNLALDALRSEIKDRFGPLPDAVEKCFDMASLRLRCRRSGIRRLDAGPKAVGASLAPDVARRLKRSIRPGKGKPLRWAETRLLFDIPTDGAAERLAAVEGLVERIERAALPKAAPARRKADAPAA